MPTAHRSRAGQSGTKRTGLCERPEGQTEARDPWPSLMSRCWSGGQGRGHGDELYPGAAGGPRWRPRPGAAGGRAGSPWEPALRSREQTQVQNQFSKGRDQGTQRGGTSKGTQTPEPEPWRHRGPPSRKDLSAPIHGDGGESACVSRGLGPAGLERPGWPAGTRGKQGSRRRRCSRREGVHVEDAGLRLVR